MSLGEKLKSIRKRFGLSQEELASIMNVSRQAITKWESDTGLPDTENLKELSRIFNLTIDYLLNNNELPLLVMKKGIDPTKYQSKIKAYSEILKDYYPVPWKIFTVVREKKKTVPEAVFDFVIGAGSIDLADALNDMSPYYLVEKDDLKLLVNIKNWVMEVSELDSLVHGKKFSFGKNNYQIHQELKY